MLVALLLMICWAAAELFVAIKVADAIGVFLTVVLLIASWPIGVWTVRSQGRAAWGRLGAAVAAGRAPTKEVVDGALVLIGGGLLIVPGFITDAMGILLLLPPIRALARLGIVRNFRSRLVVQATQFNREPPAYDVDSTASDLDQPKLGR
jgi:UPF0716 protein FxsA